MNQRASSRSNTKRWVLADCPNTGEEVIGSGWQREISILNTESMWWYCPACGGWHVRQSSCGHDAQHDLNAKH